MRRPTEFQTHPWPFGMPVWSQASDPAIPYVTYGPVAPGATLIAMPAFRAVCHTVIDGDTYDVLVDLGFNQYGYETIRLDGVDAPEIFHPASPSERALGLAAKSLASEKLLDRPVILLTDKDATTFGRYVAKVLYMDGPSVLVWREFGETLVLEHLTKQDVQ